jgi:hypothetical protein
MWTQAPDELEQAREMMEVFNRKAEEVNRITQRLRETIRTALG